MRRVPLPTLAAVAAAANAHAAPAPGALVGPDGERLGGLGSVRPFPGRACGSCSVCCIELGIAELNKPAWVKCDHCKLKSGKPCQIYNVRPQECRDFVCGWLAGLLEEDDRPDRSKAMLVMSADQQRLMVFLHRVYKPNARTHAFALEAARRGVEVTIVDGAYAYRLQPDGRLLQLAEETATGKIVVLPQALAPASPPPHTEHPDPRSHDA